MPGLHRIDWGYGGLGDSDNDKKLFPNIAKVANESIGLRRSVDHG